MDRINTQKIPDEAIALHRSCKADEGVIMLGGKWRKMPRATIQDLIADACCRAGHDAIKKLGIEPMLRGEVPLNVTLA